MDLEFSRPRPASVGDFECDADHVLLRVIIEKINGEVVIGETGRKRTLTESESRGSSLVAREYEDGGEGIGME